jgi:hypothetical protein
MPFGVDFPNITSGNPFTTIDPYVTSGSTTSGLTNPNGAASAPGSVWQMPIQLYNQYAGFSSLYAPKVTVLGTTATSTSVTAVNNPNLLQVGMAVSGSGVATGTTITAISGTTLTLSLATTSSVTLNQLTCTYPSNKIVNGYQPILKYVRYNSYNNPSLNAYPSVVYYADETGTVVTGYAGEAYGNTTNQAAVNVNACAGVLLYNSTASGLSGAASATALNGNWCWIQVGGLVPSVQGAASVVIGDTLLASSTATNAFTVTRQAQGTNAYPYFLGTACSNAGASSTYVTDVLINPALALL